MKRLRLAMSKPTYALVDDGLFDIINAHMWLNAERGPYRYAEKIQGLPMFYMAYLVIDVPQGMAFFWRDGNKLNNQRDNLFVCTPDESAHFSQQHLDRIRREQMLDQTGGKLRRLCAAADQAIAERGTCTAADLESALGISKHAAIRGMDKLNMFDRLTYAWIFPETDRKRGRQPLRIGPTDAILD